MLKTFSNLIHASYNPVDPDQLASDKLTVLIGIHTDFYPHSDSIIKKMIVISISSDKSSRFVFIGVACALIGSNTVLCMLMRIKHSFPYINVCQARM